MGIHSLPTPTSPAGHTVDLRPVVCRNPASDSSEKCHTCNGPRVWTSGTGILPRNRTLVLCFDGTGDSFDKDNSNVVQLVAMLKKSDPEEQLVYYQAGIGTYTSNVLKKSMFDRASKLVDLMFATRIADHITQGYLFLMENYRVGDNICLFGFSRGAITARALAGMVHKVGLLPRCNIEQLPFAYEMYARNDEKGRRLSVDFKETFSADVKIKFVGVWDTVNSVGLIEKTLPFADKNTTILHFRHAVSLDERRVKFRPFFYTGKPNRGNGQFPESPGHSAESSGDTLVAEGHTSSEKVCNDEMRAIPVRRQETDFEEVFFAGVHCDVGGGSVPNDEPNSLARIPLRWMIRETFRVETGIIFDAHMLRREVGLDMNNDIGPADPPPNPHLPEGEHSALYTPPDAKNKDFSFRRIQNAAISGLESPFLRAGGKLRRLCTREPSESSDIPPKRRRQSEEEAKEELKDALSPIYDQMKLQSGWKLFENFFWIVRRQEIEDIGTGPYKIVHNRKKGRVLYKEVIDRGIRVHRSVKTRMEAEPMAGSKKQYRPKVRFTINGEVRRLTRSEWLASHPEHFEWVN